MLALLSLVQEVVNIFSSLDSCVGNYAGDRFPRVSVTYGEWESDTAPQMSMQQLLQILQALSQGGRSQCPQPYQQPYQPDYEREQLQHLVQSLMQGGGRQPLPNGSHGANYGNNAIPEQLLQALLPLLEAFLAKD